MENKKYKVFLSYERNNQKSQNIVDSIADFLNGWDIDVYLMTRDESLGNIPENITQQIKSSDYLLQIFTEPAKVTKWMKKEWDVWNTYRDGDSQESKRAELKFIFTNETFENPSSGFIPIKKLYKEAKIRGININKDNEAKIFFSGLLSDTLKLPKRHGDIILPTCCNAKDPSLDLAKLKEFIRNFEEANQNGLECVFSNRDTALPRLKHQIDTLPNGAKIDMLGFTLRRYLIPEYKSPISEAIQRRIDKNNIKLRLLLLDPDCEATKERTKIESPNITLDKSLLLTDSKIVQNHCKNYPYPIEYRFYKTPYMGLVSFENEIFIEIYHLGKQIDETSGICGHVPILVARKDTLFFKIFKSHFESVWSISRIP